MEGWTWLTVAVNSHRKTMGPADPCRGAVVNLVGIGERLADQDLAARLASVRTASTMDIRPSPLPIEMFCRKMRSTMEVSIWAICSGGRPDSDRSRMAASAFADTPDGFSTAKCSVIVPSGLLSAHT